VTLARAIAWGGLTVAVLDGLDAVVFFGLRGVSPVRIFQAIAAGLLGSASFQGGLCTAGLGLALHLLIATTIVAVMCVAARMIPALLRRPLLTGCAYGVGVWLMMNFVVIPLSAIGSRSLTAPIVINGLLIHLVGVGIPAVLFARAAGKTEQAATRVG
jgi:hypothetical protein